jgi:hypothetical protein
MSYQKVAEIKEKGLRLLLHLLAKGEVTSVLGKITSRLKQQDALMDASLVRYFVSGLLEVVQSPVSIVFVRLEPCQGPWERRARTQYFGNASPATDLRHRSRTFNQQEAAGAGRCLISSLLTTYQIESEYLDTSLTI